VLGEAGQQSVIGASTGALLTVQATCGEIASTSATCSAR
jgi:hypothetical protein